ncbi:MAG TPA: cytochrome P450, partial [Verrucomicrobium sp.]|nr:cytochrome P450 [Verrucomicrobium sp.]
MLDTTCHVFQGEGGVTAVPTAAALTFLRELVASGGDQSSYATPYGQVYFFNHPDHAQAVLQSRNFVRPPLMRSLLGDGLLTSEAALWKSQRRLLQPAFHKPCVHAMLPGIHDALADFLPRWEQASDSGQPVEVAASMRRLTLDVILRCLFGVRFEEELETMGAALTVVIHDLGGLTATLLLEPHLVTPRRNAEFQQALKTVDDIIQRIITHHRALPPGSQDGVNILNLLHSAGSSSGEPLSEKLVRDEVASMIVGGHETIANVLSWIWEVLSLRPDLAAGLHAEVDALSDQRPLTHADLAHLPLTLGIFKEALRLFPPVWFMVRTAVEPCELGGVRLPAGAQVMISPYTLHRHPDFWPDPEMFDPSRYTVEAEAARPRTAWIPFASGRHLCLGLPLAMLEGPLILATLARRFAVQPLAGDSPPLAASPFITLRQRTGLPAFVVSRTPSISSPVSHPACVLR